MRILVSLTAAALILPLSAARGQTTFGISGGAERASKLLGDRVNPFDELYGLNVVQSVAPTVALTLDTPFYENYRFRVEARMSQTTLSIQDEDNDTTDRFTTLRTLSVVGLVEGMIVPHLQWQVGVGPVIYLPKDKIGFFQDGGPIRALIAVGVQRRVAITKTITLSAEARYDYHQFITKTLKDRGFTQFQAVHRGGLSLGIERAF